MKAVLLFVFGIVLVLSVLVALAETVNSASLLQPPRRTDSLHDLAEFAVDEFEDNPTHHAHFHFRDGSIHPVEHVLRIRDEFICFTGNASVLGGETCYSFQALDNVDFEQHPMPG